MSITTHATKFNKHVHKALCPYIAVSHDYHNFINAVQPLACVWYSVTCTVQDVCLMFATAQA